MKRKMILPLFAFVLAMVSAFAFQPVSQMAYFHVAPNSNSLGEISNTTETCQKGQTTICRINGEVAYATQLGANIQDSEDVLKYN